MANWFITESGEAVNLDMATQIVIRPAKSECEIVALFACPSENYEMKEGVDAFIMKLCLDEEEAKEFIIGLLCRHGH